MASSSLPPVPHYQVAPPTRANLDYVDLPFIDLAKITNVQDRSLLASQVRQALLTHGFFYVVGHGYSKPETDRIFDIADIPFAGVSDEEKQSYIASIRQAGSYQGYKPRSLFHINGGVDGFENYSIHRDVSKREHPEALRPFLPEIREFAKFNHLSVLYPILQLIALSLELPEDALVNLHGYDGISETYVKLKKYYPRSAEEEIKTNNVWLKGHTDIGTITILWSQPVAGLQILAKDGQWRWVKHIENALIVNVGDALDFLTGGYYKGTIHRVVRPPPDQQQYSRLGVFYFVSTDEDVKLIPMRESPLLQRVGINPRCEDDVAPTMEQWRKARTSACGQICRVSLYRTYVPHYQAALPTNADRTHHALELIFAEEGTDFHAVDYADLAIIDLTEFENAESRGLLASQVHEALLTHGFFYVIGHGYCQTDRMFDIADIPFTSVSDQEKQLYVGTMKHSGSFQGYKPRGYFHIHNGIHDQFEHYNINRDVSKRGHPEVLRPFLPEIKEFSKFNYFNILHPILRLIALSLELPEDALVNIHNYDAVGETYVRFIKYYPRSTEEEVKTNNVRFKGHTDFGSITILWSQPVAGLQILAKDGRWRWVRHIENALIVNAGDTLDFLTGGYYKGTIHRVVQPPPDQQQCTRLGVIYFATTDDDVKLIPMRESPLLQRVGINPRCEDDAAPTMGQWRRARTSAYGQSELKEGKEEGIEEEVIDGVVVKHWN